MGTSSNANFYGWILGNDAAYPNRNGFIFFDRSTPFSRVTKNSNGYYSPGPEIYPNFLTLTNQINESLRNGGRWYISLFNELEAPTGNENWDSALISSSILTPMNDGITSPSYDDEVEFLASKGVYQIIGSNDSFGSNNMVFLKTAYNFQGSYNLGGVNALQTQNGPGPYVNTAISGSALGFLIWEAISVDKGDFVIVEDPVTGVGAGAFTSKYVPDYITEDFESITKEYGVNTS